MEKFVLHLFELLKKKIIYFIKTILFTMEDEILEKISTCDEMYVDQEAAQDEEENTRTGTNRPPTAGTDVRLSSKLIILYIKNLFKIGSTHDTCYVTKTFYSYAFIRYQSSTGILWKKYVNYFFKDYKMNFCFSELILTITETWGDRNYCGLTGIEVVDINDADCVIQSYDARPRDITVLSTNINDVRTLDK